MHHNNGGYLLNGLQKTFCEHRSLSVTCHHLLLHKVVEPVQAVVEVQAPSSLSPVALQVGGARHRGAAPPPVSYWLEVSSWTSRLQRAPRERE